MHFKNTILIQSNAAFILMPKNSYAIVDRSDFGWVCRSKWRVYSYGTSANLLKCAVTSINKKNYRLHRLILNVTDPRIIIDHIDNNGLNDCRDNLRIATHSQNGANRRANFNSSSIYKGVSKDGGFWRANVASCGKRYCVGRFKDELEAAKAYDVKAKELFGEFAKLNFPDNIISTG